TGNNDFSGIVAIPGAQPGVLPPYQERPQTYPLQFKLHFDPKSDAGKVYPLIMSVNDGSNTTAQVLRINQAIAAMKQQTEAYYDNFFASRTTVETLDPDLDAALRWA